MPTTTAISPIPVPTQLRRAVNVPSSTIEGTITALRPIVSARWPIIGRDRGPEPKVLLKVEGKEGQDRAGAHRLDPARQHPPHGCLVLQEFLERACVLPLAQVLPFPAGDVAKSHPQQNRPHN